MSTTKDTYLCKFNSFPLNMHNVCVSGLHLQWCDFSMVQALDKSLFPTLSTLGKSTWEDTETNCVADVCVRLSVQILCVGGAFTTSKVVFFKRTVPNMQVRRSPFKYMIIDVMTLDTLV